ncbi:unnamed protein product [Merluccius merluccius]
MDAFRCVPASISLLHRPLELQREGGSPQTQVAGDGLRSAGLERCSALGFGGDSVGVDRLKTAAGLGRTLSGDCYPLIARLFLEDGETLVLTETDELTRAYCEDSSWSPNTPTPASGGTTISPMPNRVDATAAATATAMSLQRAQPSRTPAREDRPSPSNANRRGNIKQVGPGGKQPIKTTLTSTGLTTTTSTSLLSHQDLRSSNHTETYEAAEDRDTVSCVINSPIDSTNQSTSNASNTMRSNGLTRGKDNQHNQVIPEPDLAGGTAQRRPANVTDPQEEPALSLWSRAGAGGGVRGRVGEGEERRAEAHVPISPPEEGQTWGGSAGGAALRWSPGAGGAADPNPTITTWEAGWNVTNAIQGMFVLGLPYALVRSGYLGLLLLVLAAWICNHTGNMLVACLYEEENQGCGRGGLTPGLVRVRHSYQDIAEACCKGLWPNWAGLAGWMVNIAQVIELLMTCTLYLVVSATLLSDSLWWTAVPRSACSLASFLFLLPCLLLRDLRPVSTLSMLCSLAHVFISLLVILYCLSAARGWSLSSLSLAVEPGDFLVSVGIIIFSYTSQIFLPTLEGSMEHRGQFPAMLGCTHAAACIMKTTFSLLVCTAASASTHARGGPMAVSHPTLLVRGALLMTSYLLALLVPRFSLLMGLTGSVTGAAIALILPCVFHLRLHWRRLGARERLTDVAILSLGLICSASGLICSLKRLVEGL